MNYRQDYGQYHESGRSRRCISYSINTDEVYNRNGPPNGPSYSRETRSPENWRIRTNSAEPPRNINVDPKLMSINRLVDAINPSIISEYLERTYQFLKGPETEIWFPNITLFKEELLIRLTDKNNLHCTSFDRNCKSLARDVLNILDRSRGEFEWVHAYGKDKNQRVLMYQKIYLDRRGSHEREVFKVPQYAREKFVSNSKELSLLDRELAMYGDRSHNISEPSEKALSDISDEFDEPKQRSGLTKKQKSFRNLCERVTTPFIMSTLQTIIDFVDDESRQTIEFKDQPVDRSRFIKSVTTIMKNKNLMSLLPNESYNLALRLSKDKERGMSLNIREGRMMGRNQLRTVSIKKHYQPKKKFLKKNGRNNESDRLTDYDPKQLFMNSLTSSKQDGNSNRQTNDSGSLNREKSASDRVYNTSKGIDWCREGRDSGNEASVNEDRGRPRRRHKLIEALSQPIELDKAKGMMEKMGWKGGALGARGEGITEPIMPALDLKAGAGLGHTYQRPIRSRKTGSFSADRKFTININARSYSEFRYTILDETLALLRRKGMGLMMEIGVENPLDDKERRFLYDMVDGFNNRDPVTSEAEKEKDLNCRILANMNNNMKLELGIDVSRDNKLITITKTMLRSKRHSRRRRRKKSRDNISGDDSDAECTVSHNDIERLAEELMDKHPNEAKRTIIALSFRITFLKNILKFVEEDKDSSNISFKGQITKKQRKFLENLVININRREKGGYSTRTENSTYSNILRNISGFKLDITFPNTRTFALQKIYRKDREARTKRESKRLNEREERDRRHTSRETRGERTRDRRSASPEQKHENRTDRYGRSENKRNNRTRSETPNSRSVTPERKNENKRESTIKSERTKDRSCTPERKVENRTEPQAKSENKKEKRSITPELESLTPEYSPPRSMTPEIKTPDISYRKDEEVMISDDESIDLDNYGDDDDDSDDEIDIDVDLNDTQSTIKDVSMEDIGNAKNESTENATKTIDVTEKVLNGEEKSDKHNTDIDEDILVIDTTETISSSPTNAEKTEKSAKTEDIKKIEEDVPELSPGSSKRSRTSSEGSETQAKRVKISEDIKTITVKAINKDIVKDIQLKIARYIDENDFLPLLKCMGIVNNNLVYITYNDLTTEWLKNVIQTENLNIQIQEYVEKEVYKVGLKIHSYINEDFKSFINRIKRYNPSVNIEAWKVIKEDNYLDFVVYILEIDGMSYKYICENSFSLYAGIDKVELTRVWS